METQDTTRQRYEEALGAFVCKVEQDAHVLAVILLGSLAYDEVWEKSDIDLFLISREEKEPPRSYCLVEHGINIHAEIGPRSAFRKLIEGALQSSFIHSAFSRSRLLFSRDDTLKDLYEGVNRIGDRDRELQLLRAATGVLPALVKAEKWLHVKDDLTYSFLWIMKMVDGLAQIEVIDHGEVTGREVIHQALKHNPDFFHAIYTDLIHGPKDREAIQNALQRINDYLDERISLLFRPILDYLAEAGGARSTTELDEHFKQRAQVGSLALAYEWLADKEIIQKVSTPLRLTQKSRVQVEEAAYYYDS